MAGPYEPIHRTLTVEQTRIEIIKKAKNEVNVIHMCNDDIPLMKVLTDNAVDVIIT